MATKPKSIDDYLFRVSADKRAALEKLRRDIKAAVPDAEECISYQLPAFQLNGRFLVAFGAAKNHCAFYPASGPLAAHKDELKKYETSKGALRFPADRPLPAALVRKLVRTRVASTEGTSEPTKSRTTSTRRAPKATARKSKADPDVERFLQQLDHPRKKDIETIRQIILGVSPEICEGIKWNSPSFRTSDYFATVNLRVRGEQDHVWLILHTGAKAKKLKEIKIDDPSGMLEWLAKDRCLISFADGRDIRKKRPALIAILRQWIRIF